MLDGLPAAVRLGVSFWGIWEALFDLNWHFTSLKFLLFVMLLAAFVLLALLIGVGELVHLRWSTECSCSRTDSVGLGQPQVQFPVDTVQGLVKLLEHFFESARPSRLFESVYILQMLFLVLLEQVQSIAVERSELPQQFESMTSLITSILLWRRNWALHLGPFAEKRLIFWYRFGLDWSKSVGLISGTA